MAEGEQRSSGSSDWSWSATPQREPPRWQRDPPPYQYQAAHPQYQASGGSTKMPLVLTPNGSPLHMWEENPSPEKMRGITGSSREAYPARRWSSPQRPLA